MAKKMKGKLRSMQITLGVHIRNAKGVKFHGLLCCCVYDASLCVCVCVCLLAVIVGSVCGMCGVSFCSHCGNVLIH